MAWIEPVTLAGAHVRLEPIGDQHVDDLLEAAQDDEVWAWLKWHRPGTRDEMRAIVEDAQDAALRLAQVDVESGRAVGFTNYMDVSEAHRTLEVGGTWIGRPWWRTAVNTEAKLLVLGHAFEDLRANRVALKTDINNVRSQHAIARLGAQREGVIRSQYVRKDGSLRDTVLFSVIAAEWPEVRSRLQERLAAAARGG
jgi:RimJ/RimL family protein N-acetyltransferase